MNRMKNESIVVQLFFLALLVAFPAVSFADQHKTSAPASMRAPRNQRRPVIPPEGRRIPIPPVIRIRQATPRRPLIRRPVTRPRRPIPPQPPTPPPQAMEPPQATEPQLPDTAQWARGTGRRCGDGVRQCRTLNHGWRTLQHEPRRSGQDKFALRGGGSASIRPNGQIRSINRNGMHIEHNLPWWPNDCARAQRGAHCHRRTARWLSTTSLHEIRGGRSYYSRTYYYHGGYRSGGVPWLLLGRPSLLRLLPPVLLPCGLLRLGL